MNREDPYRDQAERLRQKIERKADDKETTSSRKSLPPRSEIHDQKRKKTKVKLKYPVIRLLVLFFILLPIIIFSVYTYKENQKNDSVETVADDQGGFETVHIENTDKDPEQSSDNNDTSTEKNKPEESSEKTNTESNATSEKKDEAVETNKQEGSSAGETQSGTSNSNEQTSSDKEVNETQMIYHKVQPGETLFRVAMKYYHSQAGIDIIKNANGITGNEIQVGQVLKIPASQ